MNIQAIKGFKDILPQEAGTWQRIEAEARTVFRSFGFLEIKPPLLERTELFSRSIGQETDIVSKEMYSFVDSKGVSSSLRPEATASVARAYIQHRLYQSNPVQKLFTIGPMFRHERPQKGRFRQFHQINAELYNDPGPRSDADIIIMAMTLFRRIGLEGLSLNINSLGCSECRGVFRDRLKEYLASDRDSLCPDCRRRAEVNPLRVFDCKVGDCGRLVEGAPVILDFICDECREHFDELLGYLASADVPYCINRKLVRGLDYYSRTTFEIQTDRLGAQNAVAGGGRYDGLIKLLGGPDHTGIGFAIGMERLVALLEDEAQALDAPDLFVACLGEEARKASFSWINDLREADIWVEAEYGSKSLKAQMKRADRLGARLVLIVGDDEMEKGKGVLRNMATKEQTEIDLEHLTERIQEEIRERQ